MSGYGYQHSVHESEPYWRVSWYWKSAGRYNASYVVDKAQSKNFKSESEALDFASRKRFAETQSWKPTPIIKVYVSKVEPVMRWELAES